MTARPRPFSLTIWLVVLGLLMPSAGMGAGHSGDASRVAALAAFCGAHSPLHGRPDAPNAPHDHSQCAICSLGAVAALIPVAPRLPAVSRSGVATAAAGTAQRFAAPPPAYLSRAPPPVG